MSAPLVSIICLCHNQSPWVQEALEAAWTQAYPSLELVVVDDASTDTSVLEIKKWLKDRPGVKFIPLQENIGNCRAFNIGLSQAKGRFIIDLAADDVLLPERVAVGVQALQEAGPEWGVHFSDAWYIDAAGNFLKPHYKRNVKGELLQPVPQGWVYKEVLEQYFICTPSMLMRREVLEQLGGYDESLAYEDFDFWVRSAKQWKYCYTDKVLVNKRVVPHSWSARQYEATNAQLASTLSVCKKAQALNNSPEEDRALARRLRFELRQALRYRQAHIAAAFLALKKEVWPVRWEDALYAYLIKRKSRQ